MELSTEERGLLRRAINREPEAFSELYLRYRPSVLRHVYYVVGDTDQADDITSEAFLRAWNAIHRFEERGISIQAWLLKIGYNLASRHMKRSRRIRNVEDFDLLPLEDDDRKSPEWLAEKAQQAQALQRAILSLPTLQRQVIVLHSINEMGYEEIASIVGKSNGAVRVIQHRALQALKTLMDGPEIQALSARIGGEAETASATKTARKLRVAGSTAKT